MSFGYYGIFIWVKGILLSKGISLVQSDWFTFYMFLAQLPGYLLSAYLIEKIGRKPSLLLFTFGTSLSALFFAFSSSPSMVIVSSLIVSIFCMGAWGLTYAYTPELYPTKFRGAANGSSAALTRLAGFIAPFYTSYFLSQDMIYVGLIGISILFIITGISNYISLPETKNKEVS
jgi:putative MFS transporter